MTFRFNDHRIDEQGRHESGFPLTLNNSSSNPTGNTVWAKFDNTTLAGITVSR
ncbi:MAG: hypothetical protein WA364_22270 [Candidatus Nitrosopolaris sp.]